MVNKSLEDFYKTRGNKIIKEVFQIGPSPSSEQMLGLCSEFLLNHKALNPTHLLEIIGIVERKILDVIRDSPKTFTTNSFIFISLNFYANLALEAPPSSLSAMHVFLESCLTSISGEHFIIEANQTYIVSIIKVLLCVHRFDQIKPLISKLIEYKRSLREDQLEEKERLYIIISECMLIQLVKLYWPDSVDLENLFGLFLEIESDLSLKSSLVVAERPPINTVVKMLLNGFSTVELVKHPPTKAISNEGVEFLLRTIHSMITPSTPIELMCDIIMILELLSALEEHERVNCAKASTIDAIYQVCLKSAHVIQIHNDLGKTLAESAALLQAPIDSSTVFPIDMVCCAFVYRLSMTISNLKTASLKLPAHIPRINTGEITRFQHQLLFRINFELTQKDPQNKHGWSALFNGIPYKDAVTLFQTLILPLIETNPTKLEDIFPITRILVSFTMFAMVHLRAKVLLPDSTPYFELFTASYVTARDVIHQQITVMIKSGPKDQKSIEKIIDLVLVSLELIGRKPIEDICNTIIFHIILLEKAKRMLANRAIMHKGLSVIDHLKTLNLADLRIDLKRKLQPILPEPEFAAFFREIH